MMNSTLEVLEFLKTGNFERLLGLAESGWFEAKLSPYVFSGDRQKLELAKDVSALANTGGGILLIGFETAHSQEKAGERIETVTPFPLTMMNIDQIRKLLAEWVHPSLEGVDVLTFESKDGTGKGVAAIVVDDTLTKLGKPYLVTKMLDVKDGVIGTQFGYFERVQDRVPTISVGRMHQLISAGQSFSAIMDRLAFIERALVLDKPLASKDNPASPLEPESLALVAFPVGDRAKGGISGQVVKNRVWAARTAADKNASPVVYFTAAAQDSCDFPTLFRSSRERVVRLVENPPKLRPDGFGLNAFRPSEILEGRARRSVSSGYRLMELWRDGLLISVGPGDEDSLAWASNGGLRDPIRINNFVLAETILVFCWLVQLIFSEADPKPSMLRLTAGFDYLTRDEKAAILSSVPFGRMAGFSEPKKAPDTQCEFEYLTSLVEFDPERAGYALLSDIYNWFGYDSIDVPYIDREGASPKLSAMAMTKKPLPLPSEVPTPQQA